MDKRDFARYGVKINFRGVGGVGGGEGGGVGGGEGGGVGGGGVGGRGWGGGGGGGGGGCLIYSYCNNP